MRSLRWKASVGCAAAVVLGLASGAYAAPSVTAATTVPRPDHVVVVIFENHGYSQIIGSSQAPYINSLAKAGASFTASHGVTHPIQPNYVALFSGSPQGLTDDSCPHTFKTTNLASML